VKANVTVRVGGKREPGQLSLGFDPENKHRVNSGHLWIYMRGRSFNPCKTNLNAAHPVASSQRPRRSVAGDVKGKKIAQATAHGGSRDKLTGTTATASVKRPKALYLRITSRPQQLVGGAWETSCWGTRSEGSTRPTKSEFAGKTPFVRRLKLPIARASCGVSASAHLTKGGFIKVQLYAKR
jgi:hypothetical protein